MTENAISPCHSDRYTHKLLPKLLILEDPCRVGVNDLSPCQISAADAGCGNEGSADELSSLSYLQNPVDKGGLIGLWWPPLKTAWTQNKCVDAVYSTCLQHFIYLTFFNWLNITSKYNIVYSVCFYNISNSWVQSLRGEVRCFWSCYGGGQLVWLEVLAKGVPSVCVVQEADSWVNRTW